MKKEIKLFDNKSAFISEDLYLEYAKWMGPFGDHTPAYMVAVLDLNDEMSEEELSEKLEQGLKEDIEVSQMICHFFEAPGNREKLNQLLNGEIDEIKLDEC